MSDEVSEKIVKDRLISLENFLRKQSLFANDTCNWAADNIQNFLNGNYKSLDHAFGLRSTKRGPKSMSSGTHDKWVPDALLDVLNMQVEKNRCPNTQEMAYIGRKYGLGSTLSHSEDDHAIASELKRILQRYKTIAIKEIANRIKIIL